VFLSFRLSYEIWYVKFFTVKIDPFLVVGVAPVKLSLFVQREKLRRRGGVVVGQIVYDEIVVQEVGCDFWPWLEMLLVFLILLNCCWLIGFSEAINK
jgi:hypothetical protein